MKNEYRKQLISDIITVGICMAVALVIMTAGFGVVFNAALIIALVCTGVPFGWRMLDGFVTISFWGGVLKVLLTVVIGAPLILILLVKDLKEYLKAK